MLDLDQWDLKVALTKKLKHFELWSFLDKLERVLVFNLKWEKLVVKNSALKNLISSSHDTFFAKTFFPSLYRPLDEWISILSYYPSCKSDFQDFPFRNFTKPRGSVMWSEIKRLVMFLCILLLCYFTIWLNFHAVTDVTIWQIFGGFRVSVRK